MTAALRPSGEGPAAGAGAGRQWQGRGSLRAIEQAAAAVATGDLVEAERALRSRLLEEPGDADVLERLAAIANDDGRIEEAAMLLRRAGAADPSPRRQLALAHQLLGLGGPAVALAHVEALSAWDRSTFELRAFEATLLGMVGEHRRQLAIYSALAAEQPRHAMLRIHIANALNTVGRAGEAVAELRAAIRIAPNFGIAYWTLANLKSFEFADRDVAAMRKALRGKLADADRVHFEFALGKALEQRRQHQQSFDDYHSGNRLRSAGLAPEQMQVTGFVDAAIAAFSGELLDRHRRPASGDGGPIFVIGLHRSGSTLVEQMLASHPLIEGSGELPVMQQIWQRLARSAARGGRSIFDELSGWDTARFEAIGAEYLERTQPFRRTGRPWFVDKLPANWLNLGLILLALPDARIVDARRHPMACGFSNFKQLYATGVNYAYSLESIGRFYRDYLRLLRHFDSLRPGAVRHVVNERLIDDPRAEVERLLGYVGVPFDARCLDFHRNDRAVQTPSAQQVRRPLNRDGVDAWRAYEPWLGELKAALGAAVEDWAD